MSVAIFNLCMVGVLQASMQLVQAYTTTLNSTGQEDLPVENTREDFK